MRWLQGFDVIYLIDQYCYGQFIRYLDSTTTCFIGCRQFCYNVGYLPGYFHSSCGLGGPTFKFLKRSENSLVLVWRVNIQRENDIFLVFFLHFENV